MRTIAGFAAVLCIVAIGCDGAGSSGPIVANPYEEAPAERQGASSAPPVPASRPKPPTSNRTAPVAPGRPRAVQMSAPHPASSQARPAVVRDEGAQAAPLVLSEYSRMARRAADMLNELTEIHITVDESGNADPYQDRWGELTADLTQLHREVLQSGYPPPDVAQHLKESWLPLLEEAISKAEDAIILHSAVESGIATCHAEAEAIYAHLTHPREDAPPE